MMNRSILVYGDYRYLKISLAVVGIVVAAYLVHQPLGEPNGGTWLGYTLGGIATALIIWLAWYGVRKRRHGVGSWVLEEWLSAHVYLGLTLLVIVTLHAGFQVGWNVHTLAFALLVLVVFSGIYGVMAYYNVPERLVRNRGGSTLDQMMLDIAENNKKCLDIGAALSDETLSLLREAVDKVRIGGGILSQLSGTDRHCPMATALSRLQDNSNLRSDENAETIRNLVSILAQQCDLLQRARHEVRYKALLRIWLIIHIPLTFALFAALAIHIFSVFFYW